MVVRCVELPQAPLQNSPAAALQLAGGSRPARAPRFASSLHAFVARITAMKMTGFLRRSTAAHLLAILLGFLCASVQGQSPLAVDFYAATCPQVDAIVTNVVTKLAAASNVVAPSTLRLFVHDCFVEGCDGSILLLSTAANKAEVDAPDNQNLPGQAFNAVLEAKNAVEAQCPGVVSCADILAMAARDAVSLMGGPHWEVPKGRRDGLVSQAALVPGKLPGSNLNVTELTLNFAAVNLTQEDMVVLSGAHTIGFSHCDQFADRLYAYNASSPTDPAMEPAYAARLKAACPQAATAASRARVEAFDATTPFAFDNAYYKNLQQGRGLLTSDQVLFDDARTRGLVAALAADQQVFFAQFVAAMVKMGGAGVKAGAQGEVRIDCSRVN